MNATMKTISAVAGLLMLGAAFAPATTKAAEGMAPPAVDWSFSGVFGRFDRAQLQRGYQVYSNVCSACHSLKQIYYRDLVQIGLSEARIKEIAAEVQVPGDPDDSGDPTTRPAQLYDKLPAPYANEKAARAANNGALPPDLSLMVKARKGGANYVHAILTGFKEAPADFKLNEGMNYNEYFPGNQIAMPPPLSEGVVDYADGTKATVDQMSQDVSAFLAWTAEPEMEARKRLGIKVMLFLIVLTGLLYALKRSIWSDLH